MHHKKYSLIGLGGTFDHLHEGHQHFLRYAADLAETVLIGVTTDQLAQHKPFANSMESFTDRQQAVKQFCGQERIPAKVVTLTDSYGPTLEGSAVRALCVTPETSRGADKINQLRQKLGLRALPVYISDYVMAANGQPIHSAFIRAGIMNRSGLVYSQLLSKALELTPAQRHFFGQPQGPVITDPLPDPTYTAVVGDTSLETFLACGWPYQLGVYDLRTQRQDHSSVALAKLRPTKVVDNPAGWLTPALGQTLLSVIGDRPTTDLPVRHVQVAGEEDLAAVALVLLLPLGAHVYYGQQGAGIICLVVTEELKELFYQQLAS